MKVYQMMIDNNAKNALYFTSRQKCMSFIKTDMGHNPIRANTLDGKWLNDEEFASAVEGKWKAKSITFFGRSGGGYYFDSYAINEIEVI